jgi:Tfp pilus assembly protein PilO
MTSLGRLRKKFTFLLAGLAVLDLALAIYLLWPGGAKASRAEEDTLQQDYRTETHEVAPLRGMDNKLLHSREDIRRFYQEELPSKYSQISDDITKLAHDNSITYASLSYASSATDLPDIQRITIGTTISADYAKIPRFINALERDRHLFLIIEKISVSGQQSGVVTMQFRFEAYLKATQ